MLRSPATARSWASLVRSCARRTVSSSSCRRRPDTTTVQPAAARARAEARPMPDEAPVTQAMREGGAAEAIVDVRSKRVAGEDKERAGNRALEEEVGSEPASLSLTAQTRCYTDQHEHTQHLTRPCSPPRPALASASAGSPRPRPPPPRLGRHPTSTTRSAELSSTPSSRTISRDGLEPSSSSPASLIVEESAKDDEDGGARRATCRPAGERPTAA